MSMAGHLGTGRFDQPPAPPAPYLSELGAVVIAAAVAGGALVSRFAPGAAGTWWLIGPAVAGACLFLVKHRPLLLGVALVLAVMGLGARAWRGLVPPAVGDGLIAATLVTDPVEVSGGLVRVDVRIEGKRVEAWARGEDGRFLRSALAGERVLALCRPQPLEDARRLWAAARHVGSRCTLRAVRHGPPAAGPYVMANRFRRLVERGAVSLGPEKRALFTGMTYGDDRSLPMAVASDFSAAGLTHLLAVSGQNVAFVLVVFGPLLRRFARAGRVVVGGVVLTLFAVVVRFEPSVLRAVVMAVLALGSLAVGRPQPSVRRLAVAVICLVMVDPLLSLSVGFGLSVCASLALATLGPPLQQRLGDLAGTTVAAQVGVAPLLTAIGGDLPLVSLPANVLVVPVAGAMTGWGLLAGPIAGLLPASLAEVVHWPTHAALLWVTTVAAGAAHIPLGRVGPVALGVAVALGAAAWRWRARARPLVAGSVAVVVLAAVAGVAAPPDLAGARLTENVLAWRSDRHVILVIEGKTNAKRLAAALRQAEIHRADLVVITTASSSVLLPVQVVLRAATVKRLVGPSLLDVDGLEVACAGDVWAVGTTNVRVVNAKGDRLEVEVSMGPA